jgi:hypothetical protein
MSMAESSNAVPYFLLPVPFVVLLSSVLNSPVLDAIVLRRGNLGLEMSLKGSIVSSRGLENPRKLIVPQN